MIVSAIAGWYIVEKDERRTPIIAWQISEDEDGAIDQPIPITPWGFPSRLIAMDPEGKRYDLRSCMMREVDERLEQAVENSPR